VNRIEERLRDAFGAAADTVRAETVRGLPDQPSAARTRRVAPLAAAAAVAVVVIGVSVVTPLALGGGHGSPSTAGEAGASSPAALASPSGAALVVPNAFGMALGHATETLQIIGLRVTVVSEASSTVPSGAVLAQSPVAGARVRDDAIVTLVISSGATPSATYSLQPSRLVTIVPYAVTIRIPQDWRPTLGLGRVVGYSGSTGWVQLQAVTEPSGLHAACTSRAAQESEPGRRPAISYHDIDGRPGCEIWTALAPGTTPVPSMIFALVKYRATISDGANFLLVSADPATMTGLIGSIHLRH
jgi:hypothetical protein